MKPNRLRQEIAAGRVPVGHMVWEFGTRGIAKLLESSGIDFVLIDMEHSSFDIERVADLLAWMKATPVTPIVRVPQCEYHFMARIMDAGAMGAMVGNVESASQATSIVDAVKYAPRGKRGVGLGTSHTDYVVPDPSTYFREINESSSIICQIESPTGVDNAESIAEVDGVDVLWVGHFDLSQSMGIPGQFQNSRFLKSLERVVAAARKSGKAAGVQPGNMEQAQEWLSMGFNVLSSGSDSAVYRTALSTSVAAMRKCANEYNHACFEAGS